jgi:hypothetical protein
MFTTDLLVAPPAPDRTLGTLERIGDLLGLSICWVWRRGYYFALGDGWTISITPESAGRFRVELSQFLVPRSTLWALAADEDRLAGVVLDLAREVGVREEV